MPRLRHVECEFLHVPCAGRAALGAKAAMQAEVLVLGHDAAGLDRLGDVDRLGKIGRRRVERGAQRLSLGASATKEMQSVGQMSTQASHSMHARRGEHRLMSQLRQRCASANATAGRSRAPPRRRCSSARSALSACGTLKRSIERDRVVVAPFVNAHLLADQIGHRRRPLGEVLRRGKRRRSKSPPRGHARRR